MPVFLGLSLMTWLEMLPTLITLFADAEPIIDRLAAQNGGDRKAAVLRFAQTLAVPHRMTPTEEALWFDRAKGTLG